MVSREVWFYKDKNKLPYIDLNKSSKDAPALLVQTWSKEVATAFVQTVHRNYKGYTKHKILQAKEARCAMGMNGNHSKGDFKNMVRGNMINNCPVTTNAIINARPIFGPDLASLRGKTVLRMPALVIPEYVSVQREVVKCSQQDGYNGSGRIFCRWNGILVDQIKANQINHSGTCTHLYG
jgi:hypothetical protein